MLPRPPRQNFPTVTRRGLLIGGAAATGLLVAWAAWPRAYEQNLVAARGEHILDGYVKIGEDGHVTVVVPQIEMGQGSYTLIAQILADELGAEWRTIAVEPAPLNPLYANDLVATEWSEGTASHLFGDAARWIAGETARRGGLQLTGASSTVRAFEDDVRRAGAIARVLLCKAAAAQWDADWRACDTAGGFVFRGDDKIRFGALAAAAATFDAPSDVPLRTGREDRLVGTSLPRLDLPAKVDGSANYAADIRLPGMVYAAIRMGPLGNSFFKSADRKALTTRRGVISMIDTERWVAVVAQTWWAANQALDQIKPRFVTAGAFPDSDRIKAALDTALKDDGVAVVTAGNPDTVIAGSKAYNADYFVDLAPHAAIEPMAATAAIKDGVLELWLPTQVPTLARRAAARAIGFDERNVIIHPVMIGGSFGRKYETEIAAQVAIIATKLDTPVQLVWSRSEDMIQDRFRPAAAAKMFARMGPAGQLEAWQARIAAPATLAEMKSRMMDGTRPDQAVENQAGTTDPSITSSLSDGEHQRSSSSGQHRRRDRKMAIRRGQLHRIF
jgi:isoquinoline 1-oxidoreductase subunit beta